MPGRSHLTAVTSKRITVNPLFRAAYPCCSLTNNAPAIKYTKFTKYVMTTKGYAKNVAKILLVDYRPSPPCADELRAVVTIMTILSHLAYPVSFSPLNFLI